MYKGVVCSIFAVSVSACSSLGKPGSGGEDLNVFENILPVEYSNSLRPQHGLRFDSEATSRHLDILVLEGANNCFPATVRLLKIREIRIRKELISGLFHDVSANIIIQRKQLAELEQKLDRVNASTTCEVASVEGFNTDDGKMDSKGADFDSLKQRVESLLNADNQFAFDSTALNPKYKRRLQSAVSILLSNPHYILDIKGYADRVGSHDYNLKISEQRALNVRTYLNVLGIADSDMRVTWGGASFPVSKELGPEHRLVNRSVLISVSLP